MNQPFFQDDPSEKQPSALDFPSAGLAARVCLSGNWSLAAAVSAVLFALLLFSNSILAPFSRNGSTAASFMSFFVSVVLSLLLSLPVCGACHVFLTLAKGGRPQLKDMIMPFSSQPDRFLLMALAEIICALVAWSPLISLMFIPSVKQMPPALLLILTAAGTVLVIFVRLNLSQTVFLLLEDDGLGALDAVRRSISMMRGRKMRLFKTLLPFFGYAALSVLSFGIGFLWTIPYYLTVRAAFYLIEFKN